MISGVTSQSFNNVFSATYDNYKILASLAASNSTSSYFIRLRVGGTDNSASVYSNQSLNIDNTSTSATRTTAQTSWVDADLSSTDTDFFDAV